MPESATHSVLVKNILKFLDHNFGSLTEIAVREDSPTSQRGERPPMVGGFVPDVFATNVPTTLTVIGEAKTRKDLERAHSQEQILAFLEYLAATPNGVFILSVPFVAGATARRIARIAGSSFVGATTKIIVLDGFTNKGVTA
jgi:hypothetical protein